jgi:hypothetical protein
MLEHPASPSFQLWRGGSVRGLVARLLRGRPTRSCATHSRRSRRSRGRRRRIGSIRVRRRRRTSRRLERRQSEGLHGWKVAARCRSGLSGLLLFHIRCRRASECRSRPPTLAGVVISHSIGECSRLPAAGASPWRCGIRASALAMVLVVVTAKHVRYWLASSSDRFQGSLVSRRVFEQHGQDEQIARPGGRGKEGTQARRRPTLGRRRHTVRGPERCSWSAPGHMYTHLFRRRLPGLLHAPSPSPGVCLEGVLAFANRGA